MAFYGLFSSAWQMWLHATEDQTALLAFDGKAKAEAAAASLGGAWKPRKLGAAKASSGPVGAGLITRRDRSKRSAAVDQTDLLPVLPGTDFNHDGES